jgi:RHS repeat-associated protein
MSGTAGGAGNRQDYKYDLYGNRTSTTTTGSGCVNNTDCQEQPDVTIDPATNRITSNSAQYDTSGNLTAIDSLYTYSWDGAGMMTEQVASETHYQYVYDANDERIAIYTPSAKTWQFTLRDPAHNVIREVTATQSSGTWTWTWNRDHVYRGNQILATVTASDTQHFHLDHLGTPRIVTNATGQLIGTHTYYPFGTELAPTTSTESPLEPHKFTGHERDATNASSVAHTLDYMHARYYSAMVGRFLSVDPKLDLKRAVRGPSAWNRYTYVLNTPVNGTDPTGRDPGDQCSGCDDVPVNAPSLFGVHTNPAFYGGDEIGMAIEGRARQFQEATVRLVAFMRETAVNWSTVFVGPVESTARAGTGVLLGENMARVTAGAEKLGLRTFGETGATFAETMGKNMKWLADQVRSGVRIFDIGLDASRGGRAGVFFKAEVALLEKMGYTRKYVTTIEIGNTQYRLYEWVIAK